MEIDITPLIDFTRNEYLSANFMQRLGSKVELFIKERTLKGLDKDNRPFKPYSTNPFALPAAALPKYIVRQLEKSNQIKYFYRKRIKFALVMTGYAKYKAMRYAKTGYDGTVNLTMTGSMLRSFIVLQATNKSVTLGFQRQQAALIYYFNVLKGRDFIGITANDLNKLIQQLM